MKHKGALVILALFFLCRWAGAQEFFPSTQVTSDCQVLDWGTPVFAYDVTDNIFDNSMPTVVNGVAFSGTVDTSIFGTSGFGTYGVGDSTSPTAALSDGLTSILGYSLTTFQNIADGGELILGDLTVGETYKLQLFAGGSGDSVSETVKDGSSTGTLTYGGDGSGVYSIVESFVAETSMETIDFSSIGSDPAVLDAVNLRAEAAQVDEIPEPSAMSLLLACVPLALFLAVCRRGSARASLAARTLPLAGFRLR